MSLSRIRLSRPALAGATLLAISLLGTAHAATATDPAGDFLATFAGSHASTDLDILSVSATYNPGTDTFVISSTSAGPIGQTPTGIYVWGVNEGTGAPGFAGNDLPGVLFNQVIVLHPDGTGNIGATALPAGSITVSGNTLTASISGALLPSKGFAKQDYTWNLWPRDAAFASTGFNAISDFAPDNSNVATTAVPEPASSALMVTGLLLGGLLVRSKKNQG